MDHAVPEQAVPVPDRTPGVQIQEREKWSVRNKDQERGFGQERKNVPARSQIVGWLLDRRTPPAFVPVSRT